MRSLPIDYAIRNLARRPMRTAMTALTTTLVAMLLVATAAFVRGLDGTFSGAARADTAILLSSAAERDLVRSTVGAGVPELVEASVEGIRREAGVAAVSGEIHMGTKVRVAGSEITHPGFVRGVTDRAFLVHDALTLTAGRTMRTGEVIVGRLAARQLGVSDAALAVGQVLRFENGEFRIAGTFAAPGTTIESEIWAPLAELRGLTRRDDASAVFVRLADAAAFARLDLFCKRRLDLELVAIPTSAYYRELAEYFTPIRLLAYGLACLVGVAAACGGANTLSAAVADRVRELATLRAVGYGPLALARSLGEESLLLAAAGGVLGLVFAEIALSGSSVGFAMSAFTLRVDAGAVISAYCGVLALAMISAAPAILRVMRLPIAAALKEP